MCYMKGLFLGFNTIDIQFLVEKFPGPNEKLKAKQSGLYAFSISSPELSKALSALCKMNPINAARTIPSLTVFMTISP